MSFDTDVIVVGAGPAGSLAAYTLALKGIKVLLLEKNAFPRYKVCGGGLTHKIRKEIPFDLSPVIESTIHSFRFSNHFADVYTRHSPDPLMYCTMRSGLDAFLLQQAIETGAEAGMGEQVISFIQDENGVTVITRNRSFRARLLIGAEGASSIISRHAGLHDKIEMGMAWEAEINAHPDDLARFSGTVFLDWGTVPGGYAWVFPKKDHFSIGVGGPARLSGSMMQYYERFVSSISRDPSDLSGSGILFLETRSKESWPIPVRTGTSLFHSGRVIVAGDAAGLGDPLTGEGIYYAVRSGKLAAQSCSEYLSGDSRSLENYSAEINRELITELQEANRIKHVFNAFPLKIHSFVGTNDRAWRAFGRILRGERWYVDVRNGFGKWRYFWNLVCYLSGITEKWKEKRFLKSSSAS